MTHLTLALLGPMQVSIHGHSIATFPYEKVRALLAYLVIESDQPHHRDRLAALLWSNQSDSNARSNLRKALSTLRQILGDGTEDGTADPPLFLTTRHTIQFNTLVEHSLDVTVLRHLLDRQGQNLYPISELSPEHIADLEQAVVLYRGPFLDQLQLPDNDAFDAWILLHRERLHNDVIDACAKLTAYYEHQHYYQKAQQYIQRQLQLEPWNEGAHRAMMRVLAQSGRRKAALQQYARCCQILEQELAIGPEPATVAVWEAIRSGKGIASENSRGDGMFDRQPLSSSKQQAIASTHAFF